MCLQKAHSSGEDEAECSEKDDAEGLSVCKSITHQMRLFKNSDVILIVVSEKPRLVSIEHS